MMSRCGFCSTLVLFGGIKDRGTTFCGEKCHAGGQVLLLAEEIPEELVNRCAETIHQGACPKCSGPGPVDVHKSFFIWSALLITGFRCNPTVCCRMCGVKSQAADTFGSTLVGWWGFPNGLLLTPVFIVRNCIAMCFPPDTTRPSQALRQAAAAQLAGEQLAQQAAPTEPA